MSKWEKRECGGRKWEEKERKVEKEREKQKRGEGWTKAGKYNNNNKASLNFIKEIIKWKHQTKKENITESVLQWCRQSQTPQLPFLLICVC